MLLASSDNDKLMLMTQKNVNKDSYNPGKSNSERKTKNSSS